MRDFEDGEGRRWTATVRERGGPDFKGRFHFVFRPADDSENDELALLDVRWNSLHTVERTLRTMSEVELRRRLRSARGRERRPTDPSA